ncbi:MAG: FKBP-type peptidyl-prolyl cis-trans isomerase N-terminal domain-containing protein, partial [Gammaproteobacteria bacterium]|nr:FKBP-type peptidyl-prolyl cis-trans isomerase N-terminal domain-containing protein [Gammaproteobacteria bacterium]
MNHLLRRAGLVLGMAALTLSPALHAQEEAAKANLESELARECYSAGAMIGKSILEPGLELDVEAMVAGFEAALKGGELA